MYIFNGILFWKFDCQGYSKTRDLDGEQLLEQLPALQQLLHRLMGCKVHVFSSVVLYFIVKLYWSSFL